MYKKVRAALAKKQIVLWNNGKNEFLLISSVHERHAHFKHHSGIVNLDDCKEKDFLFLFPVKPKKCQQKIIHMVNWDVLPEHGIPHGHATLCGLALKKAQPEDWNIVTCKKCLERKPPRIRITISGDETYEK